MHNSGNSVTGYPGDEIDSRLHVNGDWSLQVLFYRILSADDPCFISILVKTGCKNPILINIGLKEMIRCK